MPRALFGLRSLVAGGVESAALTLHRHLNDPHWRVWLALLEDYGDLDEQSRDLRRILRPRMATSTASRREDFCFVVKALPRILGYSFRVRALLSKVRPEIFFSHSGAEFLAATRPVAHPDTIWVAGVGSDVLRDMTSKHPSLEGLFVRVLSFLYRGPHKLVTASHGLRRSLVEKLQLPPENIVVIPNPVDLVMVAQGAQQSCPEAPPEPFILGVGRLTQVKGFDLLVRSVANLDRSHGPVSLVLLGDGEERTNLQRLAQELGYCRLHMLGFEANPWRFMRAALAVAVPSRLEGFSNVTVEAMGCGVPVVVTDCPHGPREIISEGRHGILVPSDDAGALEAALASLQTEPERRTQLIQSGLERAQDFAAPTIAQCYLDFFNRLMVEPQTA